MGGHAEQVVPILVGIFIFTIIMAFIISSMGPVIPISERGASPDNINFGNDFYHPSAFVISTANNVSSSSYGVRDLIFTHSGVHNVYLNIVRNNSGYNPASTNSWLKYQNDLLFRDAGSLGPAPYTYSISYPQIEVLMNATRETDGVKAVPITFSLGDGSPSGLHNLTAYVVVNATGTTYHDALYHNDFRVSLASATELNSITFWTALGYLFTFNANWIPTYPLVAQALSAVIIMTIILCVIRMVL